MSGKRRSLVCASMEHAVTMQAKNQSRRREGLDRNTESSFRTSEPAGGPSEVLGRGAGQKRPETRIRDATKPGRQGEPSRRVKSWDTPQRQRNCNRWTRSAALPLAENAIPLSKQPRAFLQ